MLLGRWLFSGSCSVIMEEVVVVVLEKKPKAQAPQAFFFCREFNLRQHSAPFAPPQHKHDGLPRGTPAHKRRTIAYALYLHIFNIQFSAMYV